MDISAQASVYVPLVVEGWVFSVPVLPTGGPSINNEDVMQEVKWLGMLW